ncbi:MAG TPA: glycosyltransferase family A protein [Candidatus Saccharimonadales bacterium]|nr:glycosyltransferase family A protein [Candidatus Saccharimonadales bacterium]
MRVTRPTVSLVIPAYNEESHLAACLEAIARQTVRPLEVIVVDNNSTDDTAAVARRFPFVTLLHEPRQGVVYARDAGFNAARGDIIGRTDGDSVLASDWVAQVQAAFADPAVDAASGLVEYQHVGLRKVFTFIDTRIRHHLARRTGAIDELFLYGVNMAIRRSAWQIVRGKVCHIRRHHEDLDLAVHLAQAHRNIIFAPQMRATITPRQASASAPEFYKYVWSGPRVYADHRMRAQHYMYPVAVFVTALYLPIRLLYKGYNPATGHFSLVYAWRSTAPARVSPVSETI